MPIKLNTLFPVMLLCLIANEGLAARARSLTPPFEPKDDSFYICYAKRCFNNTSKTPLFQYKRYKYIGCTISRLPCHLYCGQAVPPGEPGLKQFYWTNNYPDALNAFYRCAYN